MDFEQARFNMVEQQIRPWEVLHPGVLGVIGRVAREAFVPEAYRQLAYADTEIPLGHGQAMMAPKVEARLLQALDPRPGESALEIGTGSGYLAACLGQLCRHVTSMECVAELAETARANLAANGVPNVNVIEADLFSNWPAEAGYDLIAVTGSVPLLPAELQNGLRPGGRLFVVVGESPTMEAMLITCTEAGEFRRESLFETDLGALINAPVPEHFVF